LHEIVLPALIEALAKPASYNSDKLIYEIIIPMIEGTIDISINN
jgi:hypothetical protein